MPLQIRRGLEAERTQLTSINGLVEGELLYVTDDKKLYIGTGDAGEHQGIPITGYTDEDALDVVGNALTSGTHVGIIFTYGTTQDQAGRIDASVDLSDYPGSIRATSFKGSLFGEDSTLLVDADNGKINLDGTVKGHIIPNSNEVYDLGSSAYRFRDLYLSGSSIKLGGATITAVGSTVDLPDGSTIGGKALAFTDDDGLLTDITGTVFADDSSIMIDAIDKVVYANKIVTNLIDGDISPLIVKSSSFNTIEAVGLTTGPSGPAMTLSVSNGTLDNPTNTVANDVLGGFKVLGWNNSVYKFASGVYTVWGSDANFSTQFPRSSIIFITGDNSGVQTPSAVLDGFGTLSANQLQTGVYTSSPETRPTGAKGMIIFNDTTGKFQGFDGTTWVDLS